MDSMGRYVMPASDVGAIVLALLRAGDLTPGDSPIFALLTERGVLGFCDSARRVRSVRGGDDMATEPNCFALTASGAWSGDGDPGGEDAGDPGSLRSWCVPTYGRGDGASVSDGGSEDAEEAEA